MGAFSTVAIGLAAHHYLVMPFCRNRKPPSAFATLLSANLAIALFLGITIVFHEAEKLSRNFVTLAKGLCPQALMMENFGIGSRNLPYEAEERIIGAAFAGLLAILLLVAVASLRRSRHSIKNEELRIKNE